MGVFSPTMGAGAQASIVTACARTAEVLGFSTIWQGEHVVLFDHYEPRYPFAATGVPPLPGDLAYLDPFACLALAGAVTTTIRLGTGTVILPQRNPVYLAKQAASLDVLSGGRLVLGTGLGWSAEEFRACGVPFAARGARHDEYVAAMRHLWREPIASFSGEFVSYDAARLYPKPTRGLIPFFFGGGGARMLRRVGGLGDGWLGMHHSPDETARSVRVIREAAEQHGRDPREIEIVMTPAYVRLADEDPSEVRRKLEQYDIAGVDEIALLVPPGRDAASARRNLEALADLWLSPLARDHS